MNTNSVLLEPVAVENDAQSITLPSHSQNETEPRLLDSPVRCAFRHSNRNRCRMLVTPHTAPFCPQHDTVRPDDPDAINLAPVLLGDLGEITSASQMQAILGKIFILLAQNRISTRKAAVLTYILQQLLRTLPAIDRAIDRELQSDENEKIVLVDVPRPIRD